MGTHDTLHASRCRERAHRIASLARQSEKQLGVEEDFGRVLGNRGYGAEAKLRGAVSAECDGECMVLFVDWEGWYVLYLRFEILVSLQGSADMDAVRVELDGPDHEFVGISVHRIGRVVGRRESNIKRYVREGTKRTHFFNCSLSCCRHLDRHGSGACRHSTLCTVENLVIPDPGTGPAISPSHLL